MKVSHISILYDEPDPATYKGIEYRFDRKDKTKVFNTGNPTHDYLVVMLLLGLVNGDDNTCMGSSSVDHFMMDGGKLRPEDYTDIELDNAGVEAKKLFPNAIREEGARLSEEFVKSGFDGTDAEQKEALRALEAFERLHKVRRITLKEFEKQHKVRKVKPKQ